MGVVVIPGSGADSSKQRNGQKQSVRGQGLLRRAQPYAQARLSATARKQAGQDAKEDRPGKPVDRRPENWFDEVAIAIHVGISVGHNVAVDIEPIAEPGGVENCFEKKDADDDAVTYELVGDDGLHEEGEQSKDHDLREDNQIKLFSVLNQLEMIVASYDLRSYPGQKNESEKE